MKPNQRRLAGLAAAVVVVLSLFVLAMTALKHPVAVIRVQEDAAETLNWLMNASLQAVLLVPVILLVQWLLRHRLSARWRFALWWLMILRLLLPVSFASPLSIFNYVQPHVNLAGSQFSPPAAANEAPVAPTAVGAVAPVGSPHNDSPPIIDNVPAKTPQAVPPVEPSPATPLVASEPAEALRPAPWSREFDAGEYLISLIWAVWFLVALALMAVVGIQSIAFSRRLLSARQHTPAPLNNLLADCRRIMGIRREVALLETEAVTSPVLYGLFRHRILLPWGFADRFSAVELRHVLLHELAHVKRGDLWLNWLVTALQIVHWFNPLVWLGFARLRADRELACDELVLLRSGADTGRDYGRTMLKLLEDFARPKAMPGLVGILEDKQQMQRRVRMIARFKRPSRWSALALILIAALGLVLLTDAQVREATPTEAIPADSDTAADTVLRVLDDETGNPIAGAVINANQLQLVSDTAGVARVPMTEQMKWMRGVNIFITPVGYVPKVITWPWREEFFREYSVRLQPARTIGGIVVDEAGEPVPGVRINLPSPDISGQAGIEHIAYHPEQTAAYTDMAGRWEWPYLPRDATNFWFTLTATNYMATDVYAEVIEDLTKKNGIHGIQTIHLTNTSGLTNLETVIYRGFSLTGQVIDREQQPVAGALVREVHNRSYRYRVQAVTDDRGEFALHGLKHQPTTLVAEAEGFSPKAEQIELHVGPNKNTFLLNKGRAFKGRVVDSSGTPIANALVRTDSNNQGIRLFNWTTRSDAEGRFEWTHAPYGEVLYWFEADGFIPKRQQPITADGTEHQIILEPRDPPPSASVAKPIFELRLVESEAGDGTETLPVLRQAGEEAPESPENLFVRKEALLDVSALFSAKVGTDEFTGRPVINLEFTADGQARLAEVTRTHVGRQLAFVVDGQVISAPVIAEPITGGKAQITGNFSREEAERLAQLIQQNIARKSAVIVPAAPSSQAPARFLEIITEIEFENWDKYHPQSDPLAHMERHRTRAVIGTNSWMIESDYNGRFTRWFTGTRIIARGDAITGYETGDTNPGGRAGVDGLMGFDLPAAVTWQAFGSGPVHRQGGAKLYPPGPLWEQARISPAAWSESTDLFNDNLGLPKVINIFTTDGHLIYQYEVFNSTNVLGWSVPTGFRGMAYRQRPGRRPAMHLLFAARVTAISPVNELGIPEQGGQPNAPVASTQPSSATNLFNFGLVTPAQALDVYRELTGRELIVSTQVTNVAAFIGSKSAQGSREEVAREIKALLLEQAGLVITELDGNRASVTHNEALSVKPLEDPTRRQPPPLGPDGKDVIKPDSRPRFPPRNDPGNVENSATVPMPSRPNLAQFLTLTTEIEIDYVGRQPSREAEVPPGGSNPREHHRTRSVIGTNSWMIESDWDGRVTRWFTGTRIIARGDAITGYETGDASPAGRAGVDGLMGFDLPAAVTWQAFGSGPAHRQGGAKLYPPSPFWEQARLSPAAWSERTELFNDSLGLPKSIHLVTADGESLYWYQVLAWTNVLGWNVPTEFQGVAYRQRPGSGSEVHLTFEGRVSAIDPATELVMPGQPLGGSSQPALLNDRTAADSRPRTPPPRQSVGTTTSASTAATTPFVEIEVEIEIEDRGGSSGEEEINVSRRSFVRRCIVGTNSWMIGSVFKDQTLTYWFTGTNIVTHYELNPEAAARRPNLVRFATRRFDSCDGNPGRPIGVPDLIMADLPAKLAWQAFCSGPVLRGQGKQLFPPSDLWKQTIGDTWTAHTEAFSDGLGLPKSIDLILSDGQPIYEYRVSRTTQLNGWTLPEEFQGVSYRQHITRGREVVFRFTGRIRSISPASEPLVPAPDVQPSGTSDRSGPAAQAPGEPDYPYTLETSPRAFTRVSRETDDERLKIEFLRWTENPRHTTPDAVFRVGNPGSREVLIWNVRQQVLATNAAGGLEWKTTSSDYPGRGWERATIPAGGTTVFPMSAVPDGDWRVCLLYSRVKPELVAEEDAFRGDLEAIGPVIKHQVIE